MVMFIRDKKNKWVCRIGTLEVRLWDNFASIKVFSDTPDAPCIHCQMIVLATKTGRATPASRNVIVARLRDILRLKPGSTGDESNDLKHWPQPAAKRFVIEPWRYALEVV